MRLAIGSRRRSELCGLGWIHARTNADAAGPGPARPISAARVDDAGRAHEVSILMAAGTAVGLCRGSSPALNASMMCMAEPQHGHGVLGVAGSEASSSGLGAGGAVSSSLGRGAGV